MEQFKNIRRVDLETGEPAAFSVRQLYYADKNANRIGAMVYANGEPVALTGTCSGTAIRADGTTVPMTGAISGNTAYVDLIQDCYAVEGEIRIFVKITSGNVTATLAAAVGTVRLTETNAVIDPGEIIPSVSALISAIDDAIASIPADYSDLLAAIAPVYTDLTFPVKKGRFCWQNGVLYAAKQDINTSESWTASHWVSSSLANELSWRVDDVKSAFDSAIDGYIDIGAWHENRYIKANGDAQTYNGWKATAYLEVGNAKKLTIEATSASSGAYNAFYDSEKAHLGDNFSFNAGVNTIDIPEGAYYYRLSMPNAVNIAIKWWLAADVEDTSKKIDEITDALTDSGILVPGYYEIGEWTFGSYILTNVSVGSTVSTTPVDSAGYGYKIIDCLSGEKFSVSGTGGTNPRLWAFTDSEYKLISKTSATSGQQTDVLLTAPEDGYLIVNTYTGESATYSVKKYQYVPEIVTRINEKLDKGFYSLNDVIKNSNPGYINIGAVGDTIDYTPIYSSSRLFGVFQVSQSDVFKITGSGGNASRLWCFVDSNDVVLSRSAADLSITDLILVAPANGKLIINTYFKNYNIRKQLNDGGIAYSEAVNKANYDYRNNGLDILSAFNNVTCCGDSLTASVVYTHDNGDGTHQVRSAYKKYPWILGQKIGAEAESVATGGYTATDWWGAYASRIVQKENHLIIIYLGTNGGLTDTLATDAPGTDYTQYANTNTGNYCKMVAKSLEVGARVLLIKIHHGGGGDTFTTNDVIDQIAEKFNVAVVNVPELQERKYHAFPDNTGVNDLHYNDLGYAAFAEALIRNVGILSDEMAVRLIPV